MEEGSRNLIISDHSLLTLEDQVCCWYVDYQKDERKMKIKLTDRKGEEVETQHQRWYFAGSVRYRLLASWARGDQPGITNRRQQPFQDLSMGFGP